jgi:adenine-specific DNA-methyltransferase
MANIQNSPNYDKLKKVLKEVFQLDQADLDFGIYRIMNQKRNEINDFLENRLLPQVTEILKSNGEGINTKVQQELENAIEQANSLGVDPETLPKVIELRNKLNSTTSVDSLEQEVYSHLANFFKRYYKDGDFISLRRYKKDVYAIPYEGEEVKLHWANHDQYYIKTSEYLKNYGFKLSNGKSVKFELKEASTEQNNNKEQSGKERRFQLYNEIPIEVSEDGKTLIVNFTYEEHDKKESQDKLNDEAVGILVKSIPQEFHAVLEKRPTDKNKNRTLLEKHILDFTARNSFDYFIHKDLGGFLSRELDFYIKNEVLYLDDINTDNEQDFTTQLSKVKAIKQVAQKITIFLSQIENFQKKLWLKKKFVVSTNYCITLDRIPEKYFEEIATNKAQLEEWKEIFKIDKIKGDLLTVKFSEPLSIEFLKQFPSLVIDTRFFNKEFKDKLISEYENIDEEMTGLLINSENFQANNLLYQKYQQGIDNIYIDPPYNTNASKILYKNDYEHASWCSLMENRITNGRLLLKNSGIMQIAIDDAEFHRLEAITRQVFSNENYISNIAIMHNPKGRDQSYVAVSHEYTLFAAKDKSNLKLNRLILSESDLSKKYSKKDDEGNLYRELPLRRSGSGASRTDRPYMYFPFIINSNGELSVIDKEKHAEIFKNKVFNDSFLIEYEKELNAVGSKIVLPIRDDGSKGRWRWGIDSCIEGVSNGTLFYKEYNGNFSIYQKDLADPTFLPKTLWSGERHDASTKGTNLLTDILGDNSFDYPKSIYTVMDMVSIGSSENGLVYDFFGGSGTTAHAVIKLNKEFDSNRKFILTEMGGYFNIVTKPRILKVIFTDNWKKGKPIDINGSSVIIKYHDLESYEDVLNNLTLVQNKEQSSLLASSHFNDEYMLCYMLDVESRNSLLNVDAFKNPFNYKLNITRNKESQETVIDLVETFNYLIGLHVKTMQTIRGFKVITGVTNERDEETLVIWRNTEEKSNQDLNDFFTKMEFSTRDTEFQRIYVNGDNHIENLKTGEDSWKVVLIEEEFMKRMFDVQDV